MHNLKRFLQENVTMNVGTVYQSMRRGVDYFSIIDDENITVAKWSEHAVTLEQPLGLIVVDLKSNRQQKLWIVPHDYMELIGLPRIRVVKLEVMGINYWGEFPGRIPRVHRETHNYKDNLALIQREFMLDPQSPATQPSYKHVIIQYNYQGWDSITRPEVKPTKFLKMSHNFCKKKYKSVKPDNYIWYDGPPIHAELSVSSTQPKLSQFGIYLGRKEPTNLVEFKFCLTPLHMRSPFGSEAEPPPDVPGPDSDESGSQSLARNSGTGVPVGDTETKTIDQVIQDIEDALKDK